MRAAPWNWLNSLPRRRRRVLLPPKAGADRSSGATTVRPAAGWLSMRARGLRVLSGVTRPLRTVRMSSGARFVLPAATATPLSGARAVPTRVARCFGPDRTNNDAMAPRVAGEQCAARGLRLARASSPGASLCQHRDRRRRVDCRGVVSPLVARPDSVCRSALLFLRDLGVEGHAADSPREPGHAVGVVCGRFDGAPAPRTATGRARGDRRYIHAVHGKRQAV